MSNFPMNADPDCAAKVAAIFREIVGERASRLDGSHYNDDSAAKIAVALESSRGEREARDIAFHLTDWASDAAFIVALQLFPDRFSPAEIADGIEQFIVHAPNHVAAAAVLAGWPAKDIFGITPTKSDATGSA